MLLQAIYAYYRDVGPRSGAGSGSTSGTAGAADLLRMELTGWLDLVDEGRLLSAHFGVREATLAFSLSRCRRVLGGRKEGGRVQKTKEQKLHQMQMQGGRRALLNCASGGAGEGRVQSAPPRA